MSRSARLLFLLLGLFPHPAKAFRLEWSTGSTSLSFNSATRCTLVLQADAAETQLPSEWRLLWVADTLAIEFVPEQVPAGCPSDTALVLSVVGPTTKADSIANLVTEHFCSAEGTPASIARYVFDIAASGRGKFKVVALAPDDPDSVSVIRSNEVICNGGLAGSYPPAILRAGRSHPSTQLCVAAVGVGLADAPRVEIAAPDALWRLELAIEEQSDTSLTATALVAADLPPFVLQISGASGGTGTASLDADSASALVFQPACVSYMREFDATGHTYIQPKDFAVIASRDSFHIFYIRKDMRITDNDLNEKSIGHKRSHNLNDWFPTEGTMIALEARPGQWDNHHVWAPSIVKKPNDITYWMFYTGVRDTTIAGVNTQVQRIGIATSTDLNVWTPENTWVYSHNQAQDWAEQDSTKLAGQQFRDPFVMGDPDSVGHYLMFFTAGTSDRQRLVVGVARSDSTLRNWYDVGALWNTDYVHTGAEVIESPHAFRDPGGRWWLYYTGALGYGDSVFVCFETNDSSAVNPDSTSWSAPPDTLYRFLGGDQTVQFWHGSEYLKWAPGYEYLFAYDDNQHAVVILEISWHDLHIFVLNDSCAPSVPLTVNPSCDGSRLRLSVAGTHPARGSLDLGVEVPLKTHVQLAIYDVLGRHVRTLVDEAIPAGQRIVRWNGAGADGKPVGSGVYFARLASSSDQRMVRVVFLQ